MCISISDKVACTINEQCTKETAEMWVQIAVVKQTDNIRHEKNDELSALYVNAKLQYQCQIVNASYVNYTNMKMKKGFPDCERNWRNNNVGLKCNSGYTEKSRK